MRAIYFAVLLSLLPVGQALAFTNCVAQAEHKWNGLTIEAVSQGDSCDQAVLTLVIRDKGGKPIWTRAHIASQLLSFSEEPASDAKSMIAKLADWISGAGYVPSADKLDVKAEFAFVLSQDVDAKSFADYRKQKRPIFCYVQGMESSACLVLDKDGGVVEIGGQRFPG